MADRFVRCHQAVLLRPLGPHAWRARLPNGHELTALLPRGSPARHAPAPGDRVALDISPADFAHGRIVAPDPADRATPADPARPAPPRAAGGDL
jgi:hypothetical protein